MSHAAIRPLLCLLSAAALTACGTVGTDKGAGDQPRTPMAQYPLKATAHPDEVRLAVHPGGLSPAQGEAVSALANRWLEAGAGMVTIQAPTRGADPRAAAQDSLAAQSLLVSMGVPADRVQRVGYDPEGDAPAPLVIGYAAYEAVIPVCGQAWENLSNNGSNKSMANFGCSVQANMAAQIANPADFVAPRETAPADAIRRGVIVDKYHKGDVTSGAKDAQASGAVSGSGGGSH